LSIAAENPLVFTKTIKPYETRKKNKRKTSPRTQDFAEDLMILCID
jgi:hypothetical protein